jgi:hypothetical protein
MKEVLPNWALTHCAIHHPCADRQQRVRGEERRPGHQRNGLGHIRGYAGVRAPEEIATAWRMSADALRAALCDAFGDWAPSLRQVVKPVKSSAPARSMLCP